MSRYDQESTIVVPSEVAYAAAKAFIKAEVERVAEDRREIIEAHQAYLNRPRRWWQVWREKKVWTYEEAEKDEEAKDWQGELFWVAYSSHYQDAQRITQSWHMGTPFHLTLRLAAALGVR